MDVVRDRKHLGIVMSDELRASGRLKMLVVRMSRRGERSGEWERGMGWR